MLDDVFSYDLNAKKVRYSNYRKFSGWQMVGFQMCIQTLNQKPLLNCQECLAFEWSASQMALPFKNQAKKLMFRIRASGI